MAKRYWQVGAGLTSTLGVHTEGDIVSDDQLAGPGNEPFTKQNPELSPEEQVEKYGRVVYRRYHPTREQLIAWGQEGYEGYDDFTEEVPENEGDTSVEPELDAMDLDQLREFAAKNEIKVPSKLTDPTRLMGLIRRKLTEKEINSNG